MFSLDPAVEIFFSFPADMSQLIHGRIRFPVEKEREKTSQGGLSESIFFLLFLTIFKSSLSLLQLDLLPSTPLQLSFMLVSFDNLFIDFYNVVAYTMECVETFKYIMRNINFVFALHLDPKCVFCYYFHAFLLTLGLTACYRAINDGLFHSLQTLNIKYSWRRLIFQRV